jgi:hypothetical protein
MGKYTGKICIIKNKLIAKCIAQDPYTGKLYFKLPSHLSHLDFGYCNTPSFAVDESDVEICDDETVLNYIIEHYHDKSNIEVSINNPISKNF